jgi:hypothetical protein
MSNIKEIIKKIPIIRDLAQFLYSVIMNRTFEGSGNYWEKRYKTGGNSGSGSYNRLAEFKAKVINDFIMNNNIKSAIEFGCGDGNNLSLIKYPIYLGLDISPTAIYICIEKFKTDSSKNFYVYNSMSFLDNLRIFQSDLTLSLDVLYHLVEDEVFSKYMTDLFNASSKYVIIYSSNFSQGLNVHERNRKFSDWVESNQKTFNLINKMENPFPYDKNDPDNTTHADFYFYERI